MRLHQILYVLIAALILANTLSSLADTQAMISVTLLGIIAIGVWQIEERLGDLQWPEQNPT